jgi:hypothetical protein
MKRLLRTYTFSVSGALGGLIASILHQNLLLSKLSGQLAVGQRYGLLSLLGAMVGASIGFFPSFVEGHGNYSFRGAVRTGMVGALLGGFGGMISFPPAEWLHIELNGGMKGRMIAFGLIGCSVGVAAGINGGGRAWRAIIGGSLGGFVAGAFLEWLVTNASTRTDSGIVALMVIGLFISLFISIFVNVLSDAWLEGQPGSKVDGNVYHLGKYRSPHEAIIGSAKKSEVFVYIPDALARHAAITLTRTGARLRHIGASGQTRVRGAPVTECMLRDQDMIEIGNSRLRYRERRTAVLLTTPQAKGSNAL